ncbi:DUF192 domain-containing protein [Candidatus Omnitrophota bacterium]
MKITNLRNNAILADRVKIAHTFWGRLVGLLNRQSLETGEALVLKPSNSIHTLFMRFAIDAIFLDNKGRVIAVLPSLKPFRVSPIYFNASLTIELPEGMLKSSQTKIGDIITII